ncbi:hypothetical protein [Sediminibacterium sp.]|uniref:hypothetical protein n=1 Tax=Sediminibacterium sp. TaxID=1917865 RepID=UPI0025D9DAF6|nr:hypothetical protein [Sediminibacterium sp.]MBW0177614.1 hypothetical protein [Sediminibacterium sp.]
MDAIEQDKSVKVEGFDVYGQLIIWILTVLVFSIFWVDTRYLNNSAWVLVVFYHAVGLLVLGVWQMFSSIVYYIQLKEKTAENIFFRNNILTGIVLVIFFAIVVYALSNTAESKTKEITGTCFVCFYFLLIHILAIRYWLYIKKLYS